ncbi:MAG: tetratricopeptide repeat protein [Caldilineaceae bacterium]
MPFARWLKKLRAEQDLTQEALAELVGCSPVTLRSFEIGKRRPSREMAERIAEMLQVPIDQRAEFLRLARLPVETGETTAEGEPTAAGAQPPVAPPVRPQLPPLPGLLIGREAEQNALAQLLLEEGHRLVTLVGAGGMGKTRLALETAHRLSTQLPHGAAFVTLAPLQSAQHLATTLAAALEIPLAGAQAPDEAVLNWLVDKKLLVVLDNFEHLLNDAVAITWVKDLMQRAPGVQLLVTSRERLRISGERTFELGGLHYELTGSHTLEASDAVHFFLTRATQIAGDFVLDATNRDGVARICKLVDGMPLGIELAAAWVRTLAPDEIADEITRNLDFLALAGRDALPRHRSMRAVFDHSWNLLNRAEQQVLMKLSLFRGGCTRQAAAAVAGATLPILASLIDKSLLARTEGEGQGRYFLHELISQYAAEHLQNQPYVAELEAQYAAYFVTLAETVEPRLDADDSLGWRRQITVEQDNLRAIFQRTLTERRDPNLGLRLAAALGRYWCATDVWKEGRDWLMRALALSNTEGALRAQALTALGELYHLLGNQPQAEQILDDALQRWRTLGDQNNIAWTLLQRGKAFATHAAYVEADRDLSESLALYRQLGNQPRIATLLGQLSAVAIERGDYQRAAALLAESLPGVRAANRPRPLAVTLNFYGRALLGQGDGAGALPLFSEALALFEAEEAASGVAWSLINLGLAQRATGNLPQAAHAYRRCFLVYAELERLGGMMAALEGLASVLAEAGAAEQAVQLLAAAEKLRGQSGQALSLFELEIQQKTHTLTQSVLPEPAWTLAWGKGEQLTLSELTELVSGIESPKDSGLMLILPIPSG